MWVGDVYLGLFVVYFLILLWKLDYINIEDKDIIENYFKILRWWMFFFGFFFVVLFLI